MAAGLLDGLQKKTLGKARVLRLDILVTCLGHQHANFTNQPPQSPTALQQHTQLKPGIKRNIAVDLCAAQRPYSINSQYAQESYCLANSQYELMKSRVHATGWVCVLSMHESLCGWVSSGTSDAEPAVEMTSMNT